jgi:hypothetical protein
VLFELSPLAGGGLAVFLCRSLFAAAFEELLVVAHDDIVEDSDVAASSFDAEVTEQSGADVDGKPGVDQFGGEQPAEVVRGEGDAFELRVDLRQVCAAFQKPSPDRCGCDCGAVQTVEALEQVGQRGFPDPLVGVVAVCERDGAVLAAVASDDLCDRMEQLG